MAATPQTSDGRDCSDQDFSDWQKFPKDLPLIGDDDYYDLPEYNAET